MRKDIYIFPDPLLLLTEQARQARTDNWEKGLQLAGQAEEGARQQVHWAALLESLLCASHCLLAMEIDLESIRAKLTEALGLCANLERPAYFGETLYLQGLLYLLCHEPADAETALVQALEWQTKARLREWHVLTHCALGRAYIEMGSYPAALKTLRDALSVGEDIGFDRLDQFFHSPPHLHRANIFHNIGIVYSNMDQFSRAISYYQIALETYETSAPAKAAKTLYNMGIAAQEMKAQGEALTYYQRSHKLEQLHGTPSGAAISLSGIAEIYSCTDQLPLAWSSLQDAERCLVNDEVNRDFYADILLRMGNCLVHQQQPLAALDYYHKSLTVFDETDRASSRAGLLHQKIAEVYKSLGNFEQALFHFEQYHELHAKHLQESWTEQMRQAMVQFDTERALKDREILHLHSKELEREIAERAYIQAALTEAKAELEERNRELAALSRRDQLTGLFNRRFLDEAIEPLMTIAHKIGESLSLAICDIDNFKQINDTFSHSIGDEVLRAVAEILRSSLRRTDVAVRYGGEEFIAVFPNTDQETAALMMDQFRGEVAGHNWGQIGEGLRVTISTGVANQVAHTDGHSLIRDADICLYAAKRRGKNQVITLDQLRATDIPRDLETAQPRPRHKRG